MKKGIIYSAALLMMVSSISGCNNQETQMFNITFKNYDQTVLKTIKVASGSVPHYDGENPTRESTNGYSYEFDRWLPNLTAATCDTDYIAYFNEEIANFTVTFDSDGGTPVRGQTVRYGNKITRPAAPTKSNTLDYQYTFLYWYDVSEGSDVKFNFNKKITGDITLKAKWLEDTIKYTVAFNTFGGSNIQTQFVEKNMSATQPEDPTKEPSLENTYTFDGWYLTPDCSGSPYDFGATVTKDIELYAKWVEGTRYYTVNFYNGSTLLDTKTYQYNETAEYNGPVPTKSEDDDAQYGFKGWEPSIDYPITGDTDFYAKFSSTYKYDHYLASAGSCLTQGTKEFWVKHADQRDFYLTQPVGGIIVEKGQPTSEFVNSIYSSNPNDTRLTGLGEHEFDEIDGVCHTCHQVDLTANGVVVDDHHFKNHDTKHKVPDLSYVEMSEITHEYNDGVKKQVADVFTDLPLGNVTKIKFHLIAGDSYFFFVASDGLRYGFRAGTGATIFATKQANNSWVVATSDQDNGFEVYDNSTGAWISIGTDYSTYRRSFTMTFPTTLKQLFDTKGWAYNIYISNIIGCPIREHTPHYGDLIPEVTPTDCMSDGNIAYRICDVCGATIDSEGNYVTDVSIKGEHNYNDSHYCSLCERTNILVPENVVYEGDATIDTTVKEKAPEGFINMYNVSILGTGERVGDASHTLFRYETTISNYRKIEFAVKATGVASVGIQVISDSYKLHYLPTTGPNNWVIITCTLGENDVWTMTNSVGYWVENGSSQHIASFTGTNLGRINSFYYLDQVHNSICLKFWQPQ